jgi:hypothetical protein
LQQDGGFYGVAYHCLNFPVRILGNYGATGPIFNTLNTVATGGLYSSTQALNHGALAITCRNDHAANNNINIDLVVVT